MRRNITLRNSIDTETSLSTYSSSVQNEYTDRSRDSTTNVKSIKRSVIQRSPEKVKGFGEESDNHGWIECTSRSIPGRPYYYNVRSNCKTWQRPLSRTVKLPKFSFKSRNLEAESTCNLSLVALSDQEQYEKNKQLREDAATNCVNSSQTRHQHAEILSHIYYCPPPRLPQNKRAGDSSKAYNYFNINSNRSSVASTANFEDQSLFDWTSSVSSIQSSILLPTDFLQTQLNCANNYPRLLKRHTLPALLKEKSLIVSDKDSESVISENDKNKCQNNSRLCLKKISVCDLTQNFVPKERKARKSAQKKRPECFTKPKYNNEPKKIICDAYGTRTTNYDPVVPELPPGVKASNLSDTSIDSFTTCVEMQTDTMAGVLPIHSDPKWNINAPALSEAASTCSCTCSTSSSDT